MAVIQESCPFLSLQQASRLIPPTKGDRPVHPSTLTKWIRFGVRSGDGATVRLKARKFPGGWKVTSAAIEDFLDDLTRAALAVDSAAIAPTPARRQKELAGIAAECKAAGL
jgi:hypothetical protein